MARSKFSELIAHGQSAEGVPEESPIRVTLTYDPTTSPMTGAFKVAVVGYTNIPIFKPTSSATKVCIKRCFYNGTGKSSRILFDNPSQAKKLVLESYCATWGAAMMDLVYDFMEQRDKISGPPPFGVPQMRFVRVALAVADNDRHDTFLLEEFIDEEADGKFLKYINNDQSTPLDYPSHPERNHIGQFLAFAQHIQFLKSQKMAFVSDIQGLLSVAMINSTF
jgi:hypothetical protein